MSTFLTDPPSATMAEGDLTALVARMERAVAAMEMLTSSAAQVTPALAVAADAADEFVRRASDRGVNVDARLHDAAQLLERLTAPGTTRALNALLDRLPQLEQLLTLADQAPGFVALGVDAADEVMRELQAKGVDVERGVLNGATAALRFGAHIGPAQVDAIEGVLTSGVLDPSVVQLIGTMGSSLAAAASSRPAPVGPMGALGALRNPDVKQALGLLLTFAAEFGRHLNAGTRGRDRT
jgi:hypothetical protein